MTQDQYGQVRGDVAEDEAGEYPAGQSKPMTRFEKVASALRGDRHDRDEADEVAADDQAGQVDPGMTASSDPAVDPGAATGARREDYWEVPSTRGDQVADVTSPDGPPTDPDLPVTRDASMTDPDLPVTDENEDAGVNADTGVNPAADADADAGAGAGMDPGANGHAYPDAGVDPAADAYPGTDADAGADAGVDPGAGAHAGAPVVPQDAVVTEAPGGAGRHAAAPEELHPGEAAGSLDDDFGDLAYGKLIPDAADFTAQWQQIQFRFVDDPQASVTEAAEVVAQVTAKLEAAIQERQRAIAARQEAIAERQRSLRDRWGEGTQADTETLRETLRMYRAFLDQLIGPKA
jgi:hypothetical protein